MDSQSNAYIAGNIMLNLLHQPSTFPVTREHFRPAFMFLKAWEPGYNLQFAGWRVLPHFYLPESWDLPVRREFGRGDRAGRSGSARELRAEFQRRAGYT